MESFFIRHQRIYRSIPTFILLAIRIKHLFTGHEGYIHVSHKLLKRRYCTACRKGV